VMSVNQDWILGRDKGLWDITIRFIIGIASDKRVILADITV
jgi:hypothetical protein